MVAATTGGVRVSYSEWSRRVQADHDADVNGDEGIMRTVGRSCALFAVIGVAFVLLLGVALSLLAMLVKLVVFAAILIVASGVILVAGRSLLRSLGGGRRSRSVRRWDGPGSSGTREPRRPITPMNPARHITIEPDRWTPEA